MACYMYNIIYLFGIFLPSKLTQGKKKSTNVVFGPCSSTTPIEMIDHTATSAYVSAIMANPSKTLEKFVFASSGEKITYNSAVQMAAKYSGFNDVSYIEITPEAFGALYPGVGLEMATFLKFFESVGSYMGERYDLTAGDLGIDGGRKLEELKVQDWEPVLALL